MSSEARERIAALTGQPTTVTTVTIDHKEYTVTAVETGAKPMSTDNERRIDAAARAMHGEEWEPMASVAWTDLYEKERDKYRTMARAALAAADAIADRGGFDLDAAPGLDADAGLVEIERQHGISITEVQVRTEGGKFRCDIYAGCEPDDPLTMRIGYGAGPTRTAAIRAAIAQAQKGDGVMSKPTVRSVHNEAMAHSMDAAVLYARRHTLTDDEFDTMIAHYHHAFELESRAAATVVDHMPDDYDKRQPTERIFRRSAMSCLHTALSAMDERWNKEQNHE